jgi:type IV pilus assembly protein PilY1
MTHVPARIGCIAGNGPRTHDRGMKMNKQARRVKDAKRLMVSAVVGAMLAQGVVPAYAVVSQFPGVYTAPPDANVMFTLDDSGSMQADAIPDIDPDQTGMPTSSNSNFFGLVKYPNMWGSGSAYLSLDYYRKDNSGNPNRSKAARYLRSAAGNPLYYDPSVTYLPWPTPANDKLLSTPANPGAVRISTDTPFSGGYLLNIGARVNVSGGAGAADNEANNYWPATYFVYTGTGPLPLASPGHANNVSGNFQKFEIKPSVTNYPRAATRTDCTGAVGPTGGCTYDQELQNFANWLQYYRNRRLMAKGGVATAFAKQGTNLRIGFASINSSPVVRLGVRSFSGANRTAFYNDLYPLGNQSNVLTPLRKAMDDVGKHFQTTNASNPWAQNPGTSVGTEYSCRRSFHFLSTDGFWNDTAATAPASGNNDAFSGSTPAKPDGTTYTYSNSATSPTDPLVSQFGIRPFNDGNSNSLADVAAYYWKTDLRTLANTVPSTKRDPAFWQHLSTYTIGLGVTGTNTVRRTSDNSLTIPMTEPATSPFYPYRGQPWLQSQEVRDLLITNRVGLTWPTVTGDTASTGDDLIHASMNGRGRYFSATNPTELAAGLTAALREAADTPGSLANVITSLPQVSTGTDVYQATYVPVEWTGRFYAFPQAADGTVDTTPSNARWEASNKMPAPGARNIFSWNPTLGAGSTFTMTGLTPTQLTDLGSDATKQLDMLNYLRGDGTHEVANGGLFRDRQRYTVGAVTGGVLGDIVNGSPIKGPSAGFGWDRLPPGSPGQASYATFRATGNTALDSMRDTLFVGANDGMLHAFDRLTGVERFAFVPNAVFSVPRSITGTERKLQMLADPAYSHRFTVDGPPQIGDAFIGPDASSATWKTVLVGSTGAGARSMFAMDITNPVVGAAVTDFGSSKLLWEFSESSDPADMGYVLSYPHIARMRDGTWVAIFGNGYDSVGGRAALYVVNLQTGAVLKKFTVGAAGGNGLSQPNFTVNDKREVTAIYAGDLKGNLWKFDVDNADPALWKVAFGGPPNYTPLFAGSATQPITVMPELTFHPNGGVLASFGTGKQFETEDAATTLPTNVNLNTQAIYGIWDKPGELTGFTGNSTLVQQGANTSLAAAVDVTLTGTTSLSVDWSTKRGWYLNLASGGERVNVNPQQAKSTLLVVANRPDTDPCNSGGTARIFALDPITGGAPGFGVLDANGSGTISAADKGYNVKSFSFAVLSLPALQTRKTFTDQIVTERVGTRGQTGERLGGVENRPITPTDCAQWLLAGGSNTSISGFDISLCAAGKPRVSWRQLQ